MTKPPRPSKLALERHTLRHLTERALGSIHAGATTDAGTTTTRKQEPLPNPW